MNAKEYEQIIEELISLIDEGVYIVDAQGQGIFYNDAMASIEKVNKSDVLGKEFNKAFPGIPLEESTMYKALRKKLASPTRRQTYLNLYKKEVTTENKTKPVIVNNKVVAAIEIARDLTGIQTMANTILELQEDAIKPTKTTKFGIKKYTFDDIIGENIRFKEALNRAKKAANNSSSVLILGETGTGKELFAQGIHYASDRSHKPFLAQNCAAIPDTLLEGILFGTAKGGFTGASDRAGLFEQASGGTILLDEVSAMPYDLQSKLLRALQERNIRRVGGSRDIPIDVRVIATVNEDPIALIQQGKLRRDLYYRLNVISIALPPLRDRKDDIEDLAYLFIDKHGREMGKEVQGIAPKALKKLISYDYPGNIRELENIIEQALSLHERGTVLGAEDIQWPRWGNVNDLVTTDAEMIGPLDEYLAKIEFEIIRDAMIESSGNISRAAEILQIKRQTLQHKLKKYKMV